MSDGRVVREFREGRARILRRSRIPSFYPHRVVFDHPRALFTNHRAPFPRLKPEVEAWCRLNDLDEGYDFHTASTLWNDIPVGVIGFREEVSVCAFKLRWLGQPV